MMTQIAHNAFRVTDMARSLRFYADGLGFTKAFELHDDQDRPWIVYLKISPGSFIELFYGGQADPGQPAKDKAGFTHMCLQCDDVVQTVRELERRGVRIDIQPRQGKDRNWQAWITDPDGIRIELMTIDPDSPQAKA